MINALFSSKEGGTKEFRRGDGVSFGWQTITDLYKRELARVDQGCTRMVPRLKEAHCLRDAWTKLNVHPAKIMQVCMFQTCNQSKQLLLTFLITKCLFNNLVCFFSKSKF